MIGLEGMKDFDTRIESFVQKAIEANPLYAPKMIRDSINEEIERIKDPSYVVSHEYGQTGRFPENIVRTRFNLALMADGLNLIPGVGVYLR